MYRVINYSLGIWRAGSFGDGVAEMWKVVPAARDLLWILSFTTTLVALMTIVNAKEAVKAEEVLPLVAGAGLLAAAGRGVDGSIVKVLVRVVGFAVVVLLLIRAADEQRYYLLLTGLVSAVMLHLVDRNVSRLAAPDASMYHGWDRLDRSKLDFGVMVVGGVGVGGLFAWAAVDALRYSIAAEVAVGVLGVATGSLYGLTAAAATSRRKILRPRDIAAWWCQYDNPSEGRHATLVGSRRHPIALKLRLQTAPTEPEQRKWVAAPLLAVSYARGLHVLRQASAVANHVAANPPEAS